MIQQRPIAHSDRRQKQKPGPERPRLVITIVTVLVLIIIIVSIVLTIIVIKDLPTRMGVITAVVFGLPGLMLAYFSWRYPRSSDDQASTMSQSLSSSAQTPPQVADQSDLELTNRDVALSSPAQTAFQVVVQPNTAGPALAPSLEPTAAPKPDPHTVIQPVSADAVFFFNVTDLPSPQEFFGREIDRETLLNRTAGRQATSLVGPRRIGKTWLIQYLMLAAPRRLGSRYRIGYLDATAPSCTTVAGFVATALKKLDVAPAASGEPNLLTLERAIEDLRKKGYSPVLCIDEFERLSDSAVFDYAFFSGLRAMAHAGLGLVVASKSPLIEIVDDAIGTSPFFNIFEQLTLEPFGRQEAETFIQKKGEQAGFTAREEEALLRYGQMQEEQWPPLRLQLVGKLLLESMLMQRYQPDNEHYWQKFQQRLEDKYQGAVG